MTFDDPEKLNDSYYVIRTVYSGGSSPQKLGVQCSKGLRVF